MPFYRAQVRIPATTAIPADAVTNTFHFDADNAIEEGNLDIIQLGLETFYAAVAPTVLSADLLDTPANVKYYDLEDPIPRPPIREDTIDVPAGAGNSFPSEIAICLSYQAVKIAGELQRRRRGRIYLGPVLASTAVTDNGTLRVVGTVRTTIANAAAAMADLGGGVRWAVYSPTTDVSETLADSFNDISDGWVDNAYDVLRSRGPDANARTLWTTA